MNNNKKLLFDALSSLSSIIGGVQIKFYSWKLVSYFKNENSVDTDFCVLIRSNPNGYKCCIDCDQRAQEKSKNISSSYIYKCHMGLTEMIHPAFMDEVFVGSFTFGQFHGSEKDIDARWQSVEKTIKAWKIPVNLAKKYYYQLPVFTEDKIMNIKNILELIAAYSVNSEVITLDNNTNMIKIEKYIDDNIDKDISLDDIANYLHMNPSYISSLFSKKKNITLFKFIQAMRIKKACHLLKSTDNQVRVICEMVGYKDQNYFTRVFKEVMSTTPREYRKNFNQSDSRDMSLRV
jgi:AraC-like DNA-binding protein